MYTKIKEKLFCYIKLIVNRTPVVYHIFFNFKKMIHKIPHRLSGNGINLCLEGYPSSGNSIAVNLIRKLNPNLSISSHCHSVANIKLAIKYKIPAVVLIRHPSDAIASRIVRTNYPETMAILEYIDFYRIILSFIKNITVISFDELINNSEKSIKKITESTGIKFHYDNLEKVKKNVIKDIEDWFIDMKTTPEKRGLPNIKKEKMKERIKMKLEKSNYWNKAINVYNKILETTNTRN